MKQTAVDWLVNVVQSCIAPDYIPKEIIEQAKAMEKEQIVDAYMDGVSDEHNGIYSEKSMNEYYNETFKSENIVMFMTPENGEIESIILTDNPDCGVKGITFKSE